MILECTGIAFIMVNVTCKEVSAPPPAVICPPVRTWTRDFQKQVAAEMKANPNSALAKVAVQSIGDRDVARACSKSRRR